LTTNDGLICSASALLSIGIGALQMMLDRGESLD
jgi:hypothetical protein